MTDIGDLHLDTYLPPADLQRLVAWADRQLAEITRLRIALALIDNYYQSGGDLQSHMAHIAQDALAANQ